MAMITITSYTEADWKQRLREYMSRASTRPTAIQRVAEEFGYTEGYIRKAASTMGLLSSSHSLQFIFSEEEEQALVCACIVYSRQGTPMTLKTFADIASFFRWKRRRAQIIATFL